ncbi:MAG TPA: hypothetical protein VHV51_10245 [Polyangiaceae bacterium]|jgi:hypothetical protein|nr:hypothetical protein [Polyangiaceae bacterium]
MAGYSGTPLPQKLGLKPNARFGIFGAPRDFATTLGALPHGVTVTDAARGSSPLDVILCFADSLAKLERTLPRAHERLASNGGLWICWPKKAAGIATDVTEAEARRRGLARGLVDNKVCAIDETWSGLRMVIRVVDRPRAARPATSSGRRTRQPVRTKTSSKTASHSARRAKKN